MKVTVESTVAGEGTPPASERPAMHVLATGTAIDRYVIERHLGAGGMGIVYVARDPALGRRVAIKLLHRGAPAERLRREAQALAKLDHANVVKVYDVGEHEGQSFVAMALVDGANLREWGSVRRPLRALMRAILEAGRGVAAAHGAGLIHRDLKPDNVFVSAKTGHVLVGDFGLARAADGDDDEDDGRSITTASLTGLTIEGSIVGTPAYMAPEQARGEATQASDQFAFCVMAWELLYGTRPFAGASFQELIDAVDRGAIIEPPSDRGVPARVRRALARGLAAEPADRWPSMDPLLAELAGDRARRRRVTVAIAAAAVVAAVGVFALARVTSTAVVASSCRSADERLAPIWSPARRAALEATLVTTAPAARTAIATALGAFDRYAASWRREWDETCSVRESEAPIGVTRQRLACLDRRLQAFTAVMTTLPTLDRGGVLNVVSTPDALPSLLECRSAAELSESNLPPPALRPLVVWLTGQLERGSAMMAVGQSRPGAELIAATQRVAVALRDPNLRAQAEWILGRAYLRLGRVEDARQQFELALDLATELGDDHMLASIYLEQIDAELEVGELERGRNLIPIAASAIHGLQDPPELVLQLDLNKLNVRLKQGEYPEVRAAIPALIVRARALSSHDHVAAKLYGLQALMEITAGDSAAAPAIFESALAELARIQGQTHPDYAAVLRFRAIYRISMAGEYAGGEADVRTAYDIYLTASGPDDANTVDTESMLGYLELLYGHLDTALPKLEHALEVRDLGGNPGAALEERRHLAEAVVQANELDRARALMAVNTTVNRKVADNPETAYDDLVIARIERAAGRLDDATAAVERARRGLEKLYGAGHIATMEAWLVIAQIERARGDMPAAAAAAARVTSGMYLGEARYELGKALLAQQDPTRAAVAFGQALAAFDAMGPTARPDLRAEIATWMKR